MPIDYGSPLGQVRFLISDVSETDPLLTDEQLNAVIALEGDNVKLAAAAALDAIAVSEVLVSKKITTQDLQTDGAAVAKALRDQAKALRDQALVDSDSDAIAEIVDFEPYPCPPELSAWPYVGLC